MYGPSFAGPKLPPRYEDLGNPLDAPKGQCETASDDRHPHRGDVELVDGPQNGFRVDAIVWGEESGRYGVEDGRGGVGDVDHRPTGRMVEDSGGGDGGVCSWSALAVS